MRHIRLSDALPSVPEIGIGCMRINSLSKTELEALVDEAMAAGLNFFDHADIYGGGNCESLFGSILTPERRNHMILQSKCAIRPGICYDFSGDHILSSVDGILQRLCTDHLDVLLLHRPDALMEPEEVARAFDQLKTSGKVSTFGMSNANPAQIELINHYCGGAVVIDQIQLSIAHCPTIDAGLNFNIANDAGCMRDGSILEYSRLHDMTIQAWSPFQYGMFRGTFIGSGEYPELNKVLDRLAEKYGTTPNGIAIAWILRHPGKMQAILGTTNKARILSIAEAADIVLTRDEWYELYLAAGKQLP